MDDSTRPRKDEVTGGGRNLPVWLILSPEGEKEEEEGGEAVQAKGWEGKGAACTSAPEVGAVEVEKRRDLVWMACEGGYGGERRGDDSFWLGEGTNVNGSTPEFPAGEGRRREAEEGMEMVDEEDILCPQEGERLGTPDPSLS